VSIKEIGSCGECVGPKHGCDSSVQQHGVHVVIKSLR
jgi:hypothetical protein